MKYCSDQGQKFNKNLRIHSRKDSHWLQESEWILVNISVYIQSYMGRIHGFLQNSTGRIQMDSRTSLVANFWPWVIIIQANYQTRFFVSPELSSVRDYVITHSVRSMYVCSMYVYVCGNLQNSSLYPHTLMYIVMGLGHNDSWVESHMWPQQTWGQRSSRVSVSTYFDVFSNLILQCLQKYVIAKAGETRGSRTAMFFFLNHTMHL